MVASRLFAPRLLSAADSGARVRATATRDAATMRGIAAKLGRLPNATELRTQLGRLAPGSDNPVCDRGVRLGPGRARAAGNGVAIPCLEGVVGNAKPMSLMLLVGANGKVVATSYPERFSVGARSAALVAVESVDHLGHGAAAGGGAGRQLGSVYVQVPAGALAGPSTNDLLGLLLPWTSKSDGGRLAQLA